MVRSFLTTIGFLGGLIAIFAICYFFPIVALIGFAAIVFGVIWIEIHLELSDD